MTRAITVQQPWAAAIAWGTKDIENRSKGFPTKYTGELLIHAGQRLSQRGLEDPRITEELAEYFGPQMQATGEIVAICDLADVHPDAGCCRPWGESSYARHPSGVEKQIMHLVLENRQPLKDRPWSKGMLGLWTPPAELLASVFPGRKALTQ